MRNNRTLFCIAVVCSFAVLFAAGFYFWHVMSWSDETKTLRATLTSMQEEIAELDQELEDHRKEIQQREATAAQDDENYAERLRAINVIVEDDTEYLRSLFTQLLDVSRLDYSGVPTGLGTDVVRENMIANAGAKPGSTFLNNLCPETRFAISEMEGPGNWPMDAYSFDNLQLRLVSIEGAEREYFAVMTYRVCALFIEWERQVMGFYVTVSSDGANRIVQVGDGYSVGVLA